MRLWILTIGQRPPFLVRLPNSDREDARWSGYNELSNWTRQETRLATAISCTEWGGFTPYLGGRFHEFPAQLIAQIDPPDRILFMVEYVGLTGRMSRAEIRSPPPRFSASHTFIEYLDFRPFVRSARTLAANSLVSHPLLLRTAQHYLKSSMLWSTDGFAEDALLNLMSALEGCLLLFQDFAGARTDRIDRKELRAIFSRIYVHGDADYEFIEKAGWGSLRARLVHPQVALHWSPGVTAEDYFDYHPIVRALLTYLVTGASFEDYPLN